MLADDPDPAASALPPDPPASEPRATDRRILRSKEKIRRSFVLAMRDSAADELNIRKILAGSGVGSSTFYRHYATKEDVIADIARIEVDRLAQATLPVLMSESNRVACLASAEHIEAHRDVWLALTSPRASAILREQFKEAILAASPEFTLANAVIPREPAAAICAAIFAELMVWWLRQSESTSVFKLAECIERIIVKPIFTCW